MSAFALTLNTQYAVSWTITESGRFEYYFKATAERPQHFDLITAIVDQIDHREKKFKSSTQFWWVHGHPGEEGNEEADQLARAATT